MELHASQIILNYTTTAGFIIGGLFAVWKWGVVEILRRRAERKREVDEDPDLEGDIEVTVSRISEGGYLFTISSNWRNQGVRNIFLNTKETTLTLCPVDLGKMKESRAVESEGNPVITDRPIKDIRNLRIGAKTSLLMRRHFFVNESGHYFMHMRLVRREKTSDGQFFVWTSRVHVSCNRIDSPPGTEHSQ